MENLYDITEVVEKLKTTSRTLRYYEMQGLIESTVVYPSKRRQYTAEQIDNIKQILALRALGLPVKTICNMKKDKTPLKDIILLHRADIFRLMTEKQAQINLLEEVLHNIDGDTDKQISVSIDCTDKQLEIAELCTDAILNGDFAKAHEYFDKDLEIVLGSDALRHTFILSIEPLGRFMKKESPERDNLIPNAVIYPLQYEKMKLRLKYVFHGDEICGFWMDYAE